MKENEKPNYFVAKVDLALADKLKTDLTEQGFTLSKPAYTLFNAKKKGISCTLYTSGKLVVQGAEMRTFMEFYLEPEVLKSFTFTYQEEAKELDLTPRIGADEAGKGDFFGPLCVAVLYADRENISQLAALGVRDSKGLSDKKVTEIAQKLRGQYIHHIVKINPAKYNEIYLQFGNLNSLLAWAHVTAMEQIMQKSGCKNIILDQFADERVIKKALKRKNMEPDLLQRHRAEEDIVVAGASILARHAFLEGLEKLGREFSLVLPKGASKEVIAAGKKFVSMYGQEALAKVGKLHFKTLNAILEQLDEE